MSTPGTEGTAPGPGDTGWERSSGDLPESQGPPRIYGAPVGDDATAGRPGHGAHRAGSGGGRRWVGRRPLRIIVIVVILLGLCVLIGGYFWVDSEANPSGPPGPQVIVTVAPGTGVNQLVGTLASKGVIGSSLAYRIWSQFHSLPGLLTGAYAFNKNSSFTTVRTLLATGPNVFPLAVPAGFTVSEVAGRVGQLPGHRKSAFKALATGGTVRSPWQPAGSTNLDGLLGTGVYRVLPGETDTQLLTAMINRFDKEADQLGLQAGSAALGVTPYEAITMASIVEKEGVIDKNLGPVARVILNRLAKDMPLQMDSTVLYSEGRDGGAVTSQDLRLDSPYNTYLNKGLTPTPICFPSRAALEATLHPPAGSWLFFVVVQPDGTEAFADSFAEQQANETLATQRGLA
jgi:UPF0755 protein